jgi:hypothetical protein
MACIPSLPKQIPKQFYSHNYERLLRAARIVLRMECLRRIGVNGNTCTNDRDYRLCNKHQIVTISKQVEYFDLNNKKQKETVTMNVPVAYDEFKNNNNLERMDHRAAGWRNKLDSARRLSQELQRQFGNIEEHWESVILGTLKRRGSVSSSNNDNRSVIDVDDNNSIDHKKIKVMMNTHCTVVKEESPPKFLLNDFTDQIIKDTTGFPSLSAMVCFIIIINKGEIDSIINNTHTKKLTWFEEWLFTLEKIWGRSIIRWCDSSNKYGVSKRVL